MALDLSKKELATLREHKLAVFEQRIIRNARPPITKAELTQVAKRCTGPIPDDLIALWKTTFGGAVDYELTADFKGTIASCSFRELFYPGSDGYRDLWGWIDNEAEIGDTENVDVLPFGGFEYPSRMYVCVKAGPKHGEVLAWERGLSSAWRLRLHGDAVAVVGPNLASLFAQLGFETDPREPNEDYPEGHPLVQDINAIKDAKLKTKLLEHLGTLVFDWRKALASKTIKSNKTLVRLAFLTVTEKDDVETLEKLAAAKCDMRISVSGGGTIVEWALARNAQKCLRWLLDHDVPAKKALKGGARYLTLPLAKELLKLGAIPDDQNVIEAGREKHIDVAILLAKAMIKSDRTAKKRLVDLAKKEGLKKLATSL